MAKGVEFVSKRDDSKGYLDSRQGTQLACLAFWKTEFLHFENVTYLILGSLISIVVLCCLVSLAVVVDDDG